MSHQASGWATHLRHCFFDPGVEPINLGLRRTDWMVSIYIDANGTRYTAFYCFDVPFEFNTATAISSPVLVFGSKGVIEHAIESVAHIMVSSTIPGFPGADLLVETAGFDPISEPCHFRILFC